MQLNFNQNKCIYNFKLFYNIFQLALILILDFLCFNYVTKFDDSPCNLFRTVLVIINIRTLVSIFIFLLKLSLAKRFYNHTDTDGYLYLLIAFQLCYSLQIIIFPDCVSKLWEIIPNSIYFFYTTFICDIFLGIPILIYHLFLPLFRNTVTYDENRGLLG